jgi:hypothetical protein
MDEAFANRYPVSPPGMRTDIVEDDEPEPDVPETPKLDPPEMENEPLNLTISTDEVPLEQNQQPQLFHDDANEAPFQQNEPPEHFHDDAIPYDDDDPDPPFSDPDFSDSGLTPEGEPMIGADGFFQDDNYFESPQKKVDEFGVPYYENEPHPRHHYENAPHAHPHGDSAPRSHPHYENEPHPHVVPQMEPPAYDQFHEDFGDPVSPQNPDYDRPQGHYPMSPPSDDEMYSGAEEKKIGTEDLNEISGEDDFIPIKHNSFQLSGDGPSARSMDSMDSPSRHSQPSSALKGAQDILRKNRRRRFL